MFAVPRTRPKKRRLPEDPEAADEDDRFALILAPFVVGKRSCSCARPPYRTANRVGCPLPITKLVLVSSRRRSLRLHPRHWEGLWTSARSQPKAASGTVMVADYLERYFLRAASPLLLCPYTFRYRHSDRLHRRAQASPSPWRCSSRSTPSA